MFADKQTAIETYFNTNVVGIAKVYENSSAPAATIYDEFVRLTIQFGDGQPTQIGGKGYRYFGIAMIQIYQKEGVGISRGVSLADTISALFRGLYVGSIYFQTPYVNKFPSEKGWFQVQITAPFYFDEVIP